MLSVAIDGPAGVGKSTVSKLLAKKLGWNCLDTGALYRAFTVKCLELNVDFESDISIVEASKKIKIFVKYIGGTQHTFANGKDMTSFLRTEQVDKLVPIISKVKEVRQSIVKLQREIATQENVVVEGRDIGSVVLKDSVNKFFLTASPEIRAKRRFDERTAKGEKVDFLTILTDISKRDKLDTERKTSPLLQAKDAILVDTDNLSIEQVVEKIFENVKV
ncbi:MAG: (d)CMP kinase [Clostridia bacterium]|nr:(d)CMP kinase [Clostridia bacterium]